MKRTWSLVGVAMAVAFGLAATTPATTPAQGPQLGRVMRQKLVHSQKILEAVVTSDWAGLETHSRELERLTNDPAWRALAFAEYGKYSASFVSALQELTRAAVQRDLEKTPQAYAAMTLRCVDCHRYLARARLAK